jgi:DNA (cytosine-5)-methyltransferase 1
MAHSKAAIRSSGANGAGSTASRFNAYGVLVTPDEKLVFASVKGKSTAEIHLACIDGQHYSEFRYQKCHGKHSGCTVPISEHSVPRATRAAAIADAARRLRADLLAKCPVRDDLIKAERAELDALLAWVDSLVTQPAEDKPLEGKTFLDLFSGIGGFHQGLANLGAKCIGACEIDAAARDTYRANFGAHIPMHEDVRALDPATLPPIDIIAAGFPCQSFSAAGNREGIAAKDKGPLFFEVVRIAAVTRPALILLENVKGLMTLEGGAVARQVADALAEIGYAVSMQVLDASKFGVPQQRERVFVVAQRLDLFCPQGKPFAFPAGTDSSKVVADILEKRITADRCKASMTPATTKRRSARTGQTVVGLIGGKNNQGYRVMSPNGKGATLCANSGGPGAKTGLYLADGKPRRLTPRECARMQGFPESFVPHSTPSQARKQFGNSVAVPVVSAVAEAAAKFF